MDTRPIVAITLGDPASIGPEITIKAFSTHTLLDRCRPLVVGDVTILHRALSFPGIPQVALNAIQNVSDAKFEQGTIDVFDLGICDNALPPVGEVSNLSGDAAFQYVLKAIDLAKSGEVDATVTNALNKEAMNKAGHHFDGHTEIYAHYTGVTNQTMMLVHGDLRVVHVSTHVSLRQACDRVKKARVLEVIEIADKACKDLGIASPRVAVAGLNPHCGEGGLFGTEEIEEISPAIEEARKEGINVIGPIPPDTIFSKALGGMYDIVVAMYHDQGHIPLKVVGFVYDRASKAWKSVSGVNITLGLPIIRTSVDHGTAFDQAGKGTADELSLINAIDNAIDLAKQKMRNK
ncbi:4-hydroxythreonine-4-phosphate dehydrogenase [Sphaerochaeta pleomorpha str. Grapes]|uniref:4-hydroxythreonine-4-phosphate dehydrogenase n=1 Tax=Sphaerochaeta pleomorpha (strain ATCC BAA-1885 / DSM 22778 / Grapes) TaxID=158190 RepID=G8QYY1_SPHPG|nr:4-hydroxythreonine-4-phosphate dehydrogenase PdxA [Sphaerochaeta pleomorpha]AEV30840.1 4-hydroxythreonine-4-phosphate dehydrogenase [Sphaerochaeta pleomorpha str. Grapes]